MRFDRTWWRWIRLGSIPVGAALLLLVAWHRPAQVREVLAAAAQFRPGVLALVLIAASVQVLCQATRFHALLPGRWGVPWIASARLVSAGQVANVLLPARAGDAFKVAAVRAACRPGAGSLSGSAGAVLLADKAVDLGAALILFAVLSGIHLSSHLSGWSGAGVPALLLAGGLGAVRGEPRSLGAAIPIRPRSAAWVQHLREGCSALAEPRRLAPVLALGAAAWLLETLALGWLCEALGHPIALRESLWALLLINLATCIPITPANTGTFEAAGAFALAQSGLTAPEAVAAAAAHHALQIAGAVVMASLLRIPWLTRLRSRPTGELRDFRVQASDKLRALAFYDRASRRYRASAAKRAGKWVHSVDLAPGMVAQVRGRVDRAEVADVEHLSTGRQYDIVLCAGVLDFVSNPERAFANLCRLVAPGGRLVLLVPRAGPGGLLYRLEKGRLRVRVNLYRRSWFSRLATEAGLALTRWSYPLPFNMVLLFEAPAADALAVAPASAELAEELPTPQGAIEAITYRQGWKSS